MDWITIKQSILNELNSQERNLANPQIRTNALTSIESILGPLIVANPKLLSKIGKADLLESLSKLKKLNSAEKSIVNHIYQVLNSEPIPIKKRKKTE